MPTLDDYVNRDWLQTLILQARAEDLGPQPPVEASMDAKGGGLVGGWGGDVTSEALIEADRRGEAVMRARQPGRLAGAALMPAIVAAYDKHVALTLARHDGALLQPGDEIARFVGSLRSVLAIERVALNFVCHLSGIATLTARFVDAVAPHPARVCDTRKTLPGYRGLQKYAVACGGGTSHRIGLHDAVLIKDNHIAHLPPDALADALRDAIDTARQNADAAGAPLKFVEVEVDTLEQLKAVLPVGADMILLDNMSNDELCEAVAMRDQAASSLPRPVELEASGGVSLSTVAGIAATGVDRISVGALTHSAPSLDIGLDVDLDIELDTDAGNGGASSAPGAADK